MCVRRILIVEDEGITALDLKSQLQGLGYEVTEVAVTGAQAVASVDSNPPDLVLMDIVLKGEMDGIEAVRRIRRRHEVPVIYLSAFKDDPLAQRALATNPHAYLSKPFNLSELRANLETACTQAC